MNTVALEFDLKLTRRALELAAQGIGQVSPSPLVGCVIVDRSGEIAGEGFYLYENVTHAEVIALAEAGERARNGTAYVSLEPHSHTGRTPPCTEALISAGIRRVVCPIEDPNPLVSGRGFARLREAGIEVATGILADEAARLNEKFVHWHKTGKPFVHFKAAVSLDGRIATRSGDSRWISNELSRKRAHGLRHENDAILVGARTAIIDNPLLSDRSGKTRRRPLVRVILDDSLGLSPASQIAESARNIPTIVFTASKNAAKIDALEKCGIEIVRSAAGARDLPSVLSELGKREIQSVLIEGGATVAGAFFDSGLIDKATFFVAPILIGGKDALNAVGGRGAEFIKDALRLENVEVNRRGEDLEITGYPRSQNER